MQIAANSPKASVTIQGLTFDLPSPFAEGHPLKANEADVLNQTFHENVRNNFASKVNSAKETAEKAGSAVDVASLQAQLVTYLVEYEFGARRGGGRTADPVEREAIDIATTAVRDALKKKGIVLKTVSAEQMDKFVNDALTKYPAIRQKAAAAVKARAQATQSLDLSL